MMREDGLLQIMQKVASRGGKMACHRLILLVAILGTTPFLVKGDEVRYFEQNGVTYRETRRTVQECVPETRLQPCSRTVYREQVTNENRQVVRTYWTPVTEYRLETSWVNRWNPFAEPYQVVRYVPSTRWEQRTETVQVPVACRRFVPETQTVQSPVTTWRTASRETVDRVAVVGVSGSTPILANRPDPALRPTPACGGWSPSPTQLSSGGMVSVRSSGAGAGEEVGGITRLRNEPPRYGLRPRTRGGSGNW
jgi:hypothetical protein